MMIWRWDNTIRLLVIVIFLFVLFVYIQYSGGNILSSIHDAIISNTSNHLDGWMKRNIVKVDYPNNKITSNYDNNYKTDCMETKCRSEIIACQVDTLCTTCFYNIQQSTAIHHESCYSIDSFKAVVKCSQYPCDSRLLVEEENDTQFDNFVDATTSISDIVIPSSYNNNNTAGPYEPPILPCTAKEMNQGNQAIHDFGYCTNNQLNATSILLRYKSKLYQNHFGLLDNFEACAHSYAAYKEDDRTTTNNTALQCYQLLYNAISTEEPMDTTTTTQNNDNVDYEIPYYAIQQLAIQIYNNAEQFCDCAKIAATNCPLCPYFHNFKTILYEIVDACNALDEIDCNAWDDYSTICSTKVITKFGKDAIITMDPNICTYISNGCDGSGPPIGSFRRHDCELEILPSSWDFYLTYTNYCSDTVMNDTTNSNDESNRDRPNSLLPSTTSSSTKTNNNNNNDKKKYIPPEERTKNQQQATSEYDTTNTTMHNVVEEGTKSHWFRNLILISVVISGVSYVLYTRKHRTDFVFVRYRRLVGRNYTLTDDESNVGLAMESFGTSTSL